MKKYILYFSAALFIAACTKAVSTSTTTTSAITEADAQRASVNWPNTTVDELKQGKLLYEENCGNCHKLIAPNAESEAEWRHEVPPMAKKAKVDSATELKILKYVVTMCTVK